MMYEKRTRASQEPVRSGGGNRGLLPMGGSPGEFGRTANHVVQGPYRANARKKAWDHGEKCGVFTGQGGLNGRVLPMEKKKKTSS